MAASSDTRTDDTRFVSAGYYLAAPCPRPEWAHGGAGLLPGTIVTLSHCLAEVVPAVWPSPCRPPCRPEPAALARLGISADNAAAAEAWASLRAEAAPDTWPAPFATIEDLREFVHRFVDRGADILLVGAALPSDLVAEFVAELTPGMGVSERLHALGRGLVPEAGGECAGFEVLGDGLNEFHSIICTGGEVDVHRSFGIAFNAHGLIDSLDDARRAADWASEEDHAEPCRYFPWRLSLYPP